MMRRAAAAVAAILLALACLPAARAHELQTCALELRQTGPETWRVQWKVPDRPDIRQGILPRLPDNCRVLGETTHRKTPDGDTAVFDVAAPGGLAGGTLGVAGPIAALADVLVRIVPLEGRIQVARLTPATPAYVIESAPGPWQTAGVYFRKGVDHILMGIDHLLFVLGLLLIVKDRWMLLKTITSFTLAHSITLAIATLGYASAPLPPLNAAIALSILFLGPEMVRRKRGETSLTIEHPWVVAFAFGLLHGFGFASGLTSMGLSRAEIPLALLLFNVGVEAGQLLFVFVILGLEKSFRVLQIRWTRWAEWSPAYVVGGLGAYWTIQRTIIMLGGLR
jgi:hydrogenase/urease accessory protein HupE